MNAINLPLDLSTLQRFLRGKHRTDEVAVHRYRRFLQLVAPLPGATEIGKALAARMVNPVYPAPREISAYQGGYQSYSRNYTGDSSDSGFGDPSRTEFVFLPNPDPRFLTVYAYDRETRSPNVSSIVFLRYGTYQFALVSAGIGGGSFSLLAEINDDPLTLQGALIQSSGSWPPSDPPQEFRLVRTHGPKLHPPKPE